MEDKILCCFPLETKVRDLDARLYLGLKCIREGFSCLIGSKRGVKKNMFLFPLQFIYFEKGLIANYNENNKAADNFYGKIKSNNGIVAVLDEEGGVYPKGSDNILRRTSESALKYVDVFFAWGEESKNLILQNKKNIISENIIVTGNPRFDLRKQDFNYFYKKINKSHNQLTDYILFNTSFAIANCQVPFEKLNQYHKSIMRGYFDQTKQEQYFVYQNKLVNYFINAIESVAKAFPTLKIVLRPHPAENIEVYENKLDDINNVYVIREGSSHEWIVNSLMVIHHDCTTAIEAFLFGKKVLSYCPIYNEKLTQEVPILISDQVKEEKELVEAITDCIFLKKSDKNNSDNDVLNKKMLAIKKIIANVDFDASEKIVEILKNRFYGRNFKSSNGCKNIYLKQFIQKYFYKSIRIIERFINTNDFRKLSINKFPGLNKKELKERVDLFRKINPSIPEVKIREVDLDTYLIEKKYN